MPVQCWLEIVIVYLGICCTCTSISRKVICTDVLGHCDSVLDTSRRTRAGMIADRRTAIRKEVNSKLLVKRSASPKGGSANQLGNIVSFVWLIMAEQSSNYRLGERRAL